MKYVTRSEHEVGHLIKIVKYVTRSEHEVGHLIKTVECPTRSDPEVGHLKMHKNRLVANYCCGTYLSLDLLEIVPGRKVVLRCQGGQPIVAS